MSLVNSPLDIASQREGRLRDVPCFLPSHGFHSAPEISIGPGTVPGRLFVKLPVAGSDRSPRNLPMKEITPRSSDFRHLIARLGSRKIGKNANLPHRTIFAGHFGLIGA